MYVCVCVYSGRELSVNVGGGGNGGAYRISYKSGNNYVTTSEKPSTKNESDKRMKRLIRK